MNIKNNVSLSIQEAVELLAKLADSLEQKGEFAFDLKGQEVSIEAGEQLHAQLSISPDQFSMIFDWGETADSSTEEESAKEYHEPPRMVKEVNIPERKPQRAQLQADEPQAPVVNGPKRALPDRMPLNTTTLPLEAGYWAPAFTSNPDTEWSRIEIDSELENKKWASDDQITSLSDLTPASAKPKTKRKKANPDEDLFSELDELDSPSSSKSTTQTSSKPKQTEQKPNRTAARPAARVASIPKPSATPASSQSVPGASPMGSSPAGATKKAPSKAPPSPSASIPKPSSTGKQEEWREPQKEENTSGDDWVRPSQVLKDKTSQSNSQQKANTSSIPSPSTTKTQETSTTGRRDTIPVPSAQTSQPKTSPSPSEDDRDEVQEWREPTREENETDDDWIRPSEFLKSREKEEAKEEEESINRPPPTAPDKKDKDKDKKKGWASWD